MLNKKICDEESYSQYINLLLSLSKDESEENKKRHEGIINTSQKIIGISMADIRNVAKEIYKTGSEWFTNYSISKNMRDEYYEETLIEGLVIAQIKDIDLQIKLLDKWVKKIDNWATCDSVSSTLKIIKKSKEKSKYFNYFYNLCFSRGEFSARFGIVTIMNNYLEKEYFDDIVKIVKGIKRNEYYINMALAWLISFMFIKFKDETYPVFMEKSLSKFVQNKAISKCRDSYQVDEKDKNKLILYRIK